MLSIAKTQKKLRDGKRLLAALLASACFAVASVPAQGEIINSVTAAGQIFGNPIASTAIEEVDVVDQIATLLVDKTAVLNDINGNGNADLADTISYSFAVTNTGNVTLANVSLTDDKVTPSALTLTGIDDVVPTGNSVDTAAAGWASLAPGDTLRATATYNLTQADIDAGQVINIATANAATIPGVAVTATDTVTTPLSTASSIALEKSGTLDLVNGVADVGDIITYQFRVTNTGPTTLTNVSVSDPMLLVAALPGGDQLQQLIQVAAVPADPITTASIDTVTTAGPAAREPALKGRDIPQLPASFGVERRLVKLIAEQDTFKTGDRIGVYYRITNTGDVPLTAIEALQPGSDVYGNTVELLAPNTSDASSILFTHVLTPEDIETGQVEFTSGVIAKARGQSLLQTLRGPMSLLDVEDANDVATASITPANLPTLAPGAEALFSATYELTQADIDAGQVLNTATASATNVLNDTITATDDATVAVAQAAAIIVEKTGALALGADNKATPGDLITYSFTITNVGNTTLNDVQLTDPMPNLTLNFAEFDGLVPGDSRDFTGTYPLSQADIDAGRVDNQATASGLPSNNAARVSGVSDDPALPNTDDPTIVEIPPSPEIALVKEIASVVDTNGTGITDVGDTVTYRFRVRNMGNVPLSNVYVQDRNPAVVSNLLPPTGVTLAAGVEDSTTFTATYVLIQADADRGYFDNTADTYGTAPDNTIVTDESDPAVFLENAPTRLEIPPAPALAVLKPQPVVNDTNNNGMTDAGDVLNYTLQVINTGNVTLSNIVVTDPQANNFSVTLPTLVPGLANAITVPVSYTVTVADVNAGEITNIAFAEASHAGTPVGDQSDTDNVNEDDPTITPIVPRPAVALVKPQPDIIDVDGNGVTTEGDQLVYTFRVTNTGNVSLTNITISDPLGTVVSTRTTPLLAGDTDSTSFTLTYALTTADLTAGRVTNQAEIVALTAANLVARDTSDNDSILQNDPTVTLLANLLDPQIALIKSATTADVNNNGVLDVGDSIAYTFSVTNTGNVALNNVTVTDAKLAFTGVIGTLARGATSAILTATHVITQADVDAGSYDNQATVTGMFGTRTVSDLSDDDQLTGDDRTVVALARNPAIAVVKPQPANNDRNGNGFIDSGDILTYTFEVHNTGNVTLYNVALTDTNADTVSGGPIAVLAPGAVDRTTFTATRVVNDRDALATRIENQATVRAATVDGGALDTTDVSDDDSLTGREPTVTAVVTINPALSKTAARSTIRRGERVEYTIAATALGTGPYDVADIMPPGFSFVPGSATVNGAAAVPAQSGKTLTFANITPTAARIITVKLSLRAAASTSMQTGDFLNRARLYLNATGQQLADASARVTIKEEAIFDCGEIIGRVFDDLNNNGYMDDGEPGLPGVRVVTVKGLLVTTDKHGRFHVTCADVPNAQIGSNFLMKLDPRTLPAGYGLTTENPRDVRLTRGKITKLNFGASKRRDVGLDLTKDAFGKGLDLKPRFETGVDRLVSLLKQGKGKLTITYRCGVYAPIADERLSAVEELVQAKWKQEGGNKPLKITTRVECGK